MIYFIAEVRMLTAIVSIWKSLVEMQGFFFS